MRRLSSSYRAVPATSRAFSSLRSYGAASCLSTTLTHNTARWHRDDLTTNKTLYMSNPASYSTAAAEPKPFEEVPLVSIEEIMQLGGFHKVLHLSNEINKRYGPLARSYLQGTNSVWVHHPDDIASVMKAEGKWPVGGATFVWPFVLIFKQHGVKSVAFEQAEEWKRLRGAFQKHLFAPLDAESYMPLVTPVVQDALKVIRNHQSRLDIFLPTMTLEMVASVLFGQSLGTLNGTAPEEDHEYIRQVMKMFNLGEELQFRNPADVKPEEIKPLDDAFTYVYNRGRYHMDNVLQKYESGALKAVVPPYILKSGDAKDVSKEEIAQNVVGLLMAGVDTTGNTIQWFLYNLARNPEVQEKLHAEVKSVLKGRMMEKEDLAELPYLKAALKETFRLTPTTPGTARILMEDITLRGYKVPAGSMLMLTTYPAAVDPEIFENPMSFNPDRYDRKLKADRKGSNPYHDSPYVHMPFSRGPRMCMGSRLAELEILSFVAAFAQEYKIELAPNSPVPEAISRLTIRPEPSPQYIITPRA